MTLPVLGVCDAPSVSIPHLLPLSSLKGSGRQIKMFNAQAKLAYCSVAGCSTSLHSLLKSEPVMTQLINFIFLIEMYPHHIVKLHVCANHFTLDCFVSEGQYKAEFVSSLGIPIKVLTDVSFAPSI